MCETNTVELISLPRGARFKKRSSPLFSQSLRGKVGHHGTHTYLTLEMVLYIIDIQCTLFYERSWWLQSICFVELTIFHMISLISLG